MELNRVKKVDDLIKIKNVLISVADKTNLCDFVSGMINLNDKLKIYSTGGTYEEIKSFLTNKQLSNLHKVSDYTGQPEMQGGLVKTLDFRIYLGLLSETYNKKHKEDLQRTGSEIFDMVVVNLYPFEKTIMNSEAQIEDARANIDIGGPCMLRASAKNFLRVASVCQPDDYKKLLAEMEKNNASLNLDDRFQLAKKSFQHTAEYDKIIAEYFLNKSVLGVYNA